MDYTIDVTKVEELQTIKDIDELEKIFAKAGRILNGGGSVFLVRKHANGSVDIFDTLTTADDLDTYRKTVFKYL